MKGQRQGDDEVGQGEDESTLFLFFTAFQALAEIFFGSKK